MNQGRRLTAGRRSSQAQHTERVDEGDAAPRWCDVCAVAIRWNDVWATGIVQGRLVMGRMHTVLTVVITGLAPRFDFRLILTRQTNSVRRIASVYGKITGRMLEQDRSVLNWVKR